MTDWKPTVADMHKAFAAWKRSEKPSIWHPLYVRPWSSFTLSVAGPVPGPPGPELWGEAIPTVKMTVRCVAREFAEAYIACVVGEIDIPTEHIHTRRSQTLLEGPFRIDSTFRQPPAYDDADLWLPEMVYWEEQRDGSFKRVPRPDWAPKLPPADPTSYWPGPLGWRS